VATPNPEAGNAGAPQCRLTPQGRPLRPLEALTCGARLQLSWRLALRALQHHGFKPATVFDVGVASAPGAFTAPSPTLLYLFEPTRESQPYMARLARRLRCELHPVALGDHDGEALLEIRADIQGSTLLEEVGPRDFLRFGRVPMRRFDRLFAEFDRPALCKIDVQGPS